MYGSIFIAALAATAAAKPNTARITRRDQQGTVDPGTVSDCTYYTEYPSTDFEGQGTTCDSISAYWGITVDDFIRYNPVLGSSCKLQQGHSYCVEENYGEGPAPMSTTTTSSPAMTTTADSKPSPTQAGLTEDCTRYYFVQKDDSCINIVNMYHTFTLKDFYGWNPAVKDDCTGLQANVYVCVGVPGTPTVAPTTAPGPSPTSSGPQPEQTGINSDCQKYHKVVDNENCQSIVDQYGTFTLKQFYSWNPSIGSNCEHLFKDYYVCVGLSNTPTTRPMTTTTTTTSSTATGPSPTQDGIVSTCNKYGKSKKGDTCKTLAADNNIGLDQLYAWNAVLGYSGEHCDKLLAEEYYCTGVSGPMPADGESQPGVIDTCVQYAKSVSGSTCDAFARDNKISTMNLYTWNTVLGSNGQNCQTKFFANEYYCTAVAHANNYTPQQDGIISTCNKYAISKKGSTCPAFAKDNGISDAQLHAWNSVLGNRGENCQTKFWAEEYYCVGVSGPLPAPGPSQDGVTDICTRYSKSSQGGTCPAFASNNRISEAHLYEWNSVLGNKGQNCRTKFQADVYYCVEVAS